MEEKYTKIIRYSIFALSGIFLIFLILNIMEIFQKLQDTNLMNLDTTSISAIPIIVWSILVYITFKVAFNWEHIFKSLTKTFISLAIICLTFFFLLLPIGNQSNEIVESIQPTIDTVLVSSIDDILEEQFPVENKEILISLSENNEIQNIKNTNLKKEDIDLISKTFKIESKSVEEKEIFTKIFITIIYEELTKTEQGINVPIPISQIKTMLESQIDLELLKTIDITMLENFYTPNEKAEVNILISENEIIKTINPSNLSQEEINLIWKNLDLSKNVSIQTKEKLISLILSITTTTLENQELNLNIAIPIATLGSMIPKDIKPILSYDLFANNTKKRIEALNNIRTDCNNNSNEYLEEVCEAISMTEYNNMMGSLEEITNQGNIILPFEISKIIEPISTKEKIENKLKNIKGLSYKFLIGYICLFLIAILSYYLHFKLFNRELINIHIPYYISKINLISYIFNFIILGLIYILINSDYLLSTTENFFEQTQIIDLSILINLPIFEIIKIVNQEMFILASIYLIISIGSYVTFYLLQKRTIENAEINRINSEIEE